MTDQTVNEVEQGFYMKDVSYFGEKIEELKKHPILRDNLISIIEDFELAYKGTMDSKFNLEEHQIAQIKTDLLTAFAYGCVVATDSNSNFRKRFKLPVEMDPSKKIIQPVSKIIMP